jgi:hypothetical protein
MSNWPPVEIEESIMGSPEALVDECYRMISFAAGSLPAWDRFKSLFVEKAILILRVFPGDESISVMNLDQYTNQQIREGMKEEGYTETPIKQEWFGFGDVLETRVIFTMQFGEKDPITAFDIFQLVKLEGRWWITSITGEIPKPGVEVPKDLLTK